ncbi:hypothetical protein GCM10010451_37490 [Streptomyces virens]|uniref:Uncharacterized protein n=1 Tax=Streptomyces virens TaxID=285572 RepID=A0ABP6PPP4_9ACTN|nr:hypothetical protein GCM10010247_63980 [Streptomyces calvus]
MHRIARKAPRLRPVTGDEARGCGEETSALGGIRRADPAALSAPGGSPRPHRGTARGGHLRPHRATYAGPAELAASVRQFIAAPLPRAAPAARPPTAEPW